MGVTEEVVKAEAVNRGSRTKVMMLMPEEPGNNVQITLSIIEAAATGG